MGVDKLQPTTGIKDVTRNLEEHELDGLIKTNNNILPRLAISHSQILLCSIPKVYEARQREAAQSLRLRNFVDADDVGNEQDDEVDPAIELESEVRDAWAQTEYWGGGQSPFNMYNVGYIVRFLQITSIVLLLLIISVVVVLTITIYKYVS